MKIYKLDIDAAQPVNQIVQMQQNTAGVLSVDVTRNGNYIRNLSCQIFDGETEIPACSAGDKGFKLDIGDTPKHYTVKATATPVECIYQTVTGGSGGAARSYSVSCVQLEAGTYRQDEFVNVANKFASSNGIVEALVVHANDLSNVNFGSIEIKRGWDKKNYMYFHTGVNFGSDLLPPDAPIVATGPVNIFRTMVGKRNATVSSYTYPAVGYYVNYQSDTLVKPSPNANAFSEIEVLPTEAGFQTLSADSFTADSFTLSGVTYVPTTLSVDGVAYTVLAAPVETPEETPEEPEG